MSKKSQVVLETSLGTVVLELFPEKAPKTVANFIRYVQSGHYNQTLFHRVIKGFMIQGGGFDPDFKQKETQDPIENESDNGLKNEKYSVAMARTNDPNSATAQFFINTNDNEFLNFTAKTAQGAGYAVFGKVSDGQAVLDTIEQVRTGAKGFHQDVPIDAVMILRATYRGDDITGEQQVNEQPPQQQQTGPSHQDESDASGIKVFTGSKQAATPFSRGTLITSHEVDGAASNITITVGDEPGSGGANHRYDFTGFDTNTNASNEDAQGYRTSYGRLTLLFQNGTIPEKGNNGLTLEALTAALIHRLEGFQAGPFASADNQEALDHYKGALSALQRRTRDRLARQVEGKLEK